jgi:DNA-binding MarR family transcriptional regulator
MAVKDSTLVGQWRDLQDRYLKTAAAIERELNARHGIGLSEFETLDLIAEIDDPASPCRMKDLGTISPMTQSALSRVVDRLQKAGLVSRSSCADDRRALLVCMTDAGRSLHAEAARTHRRLLADNLGEAGS